MVRCFKTAGKLPQIIRRVSLPEKYLFRRFQPKREETSGRQHITLQNNPLFACSQHQYGRANQFPVGRKSGQDWPLPPFSSSVQKRQTM
jgi:hypothetical protein